MSVAKKTIKKTKTVASKKPKATSEAGIKIYSLSGDVVKLKELSKKVFDVKINPSLLAQYIRVYQTNQRQGNASAKSRGEVSGSTKKIYRQKGTGRARHGSMKAPIFVGGGVVGGPQPHDYYLKINKKQKQQALFNALTIKNKDNEICGLTYEDKSLKPKTKNIFQLLKKLGYENKQVLCILPKIEKNNFILAARNIPNLTMVDVLSLNAYEVLKAKILIFNEQALDILISKLPNES